MIGQKQYSLRDKHTGKSPDDVRVAEPAAVVKQRLANMAPKKKGKAASRAAKPVTKNKGKK